MPKRPLEPLEEASEDGLVKHLVELAHRHREPFCAVIIEPSSGEILATDINLSRVDPTQHNEMAALRDLISRHPKKDRSALALYTTAEPCPCAPQRLFGAISATLLTEFEEQNL